VKWISILLLLVSLSVFNSTWFSSSSSSSSSLMHYIVVLGDLNYLFRRKKERLTRKPFIT